MVNSARAHHAQFPPAAYSAIFLETSRRYLGLAGAAQPLALISSAAAGDFVDPVQYRLNTQPYGGRGTA